MTEQENINYYSTIGEQLKKRYPELDKEEIAALTRETVFAPNSYTVEINDCTTQISDIRENLADSIEREKSEQKFIPYSLDSAIADLIEANNCETSSMNEYYRWISVTADIVQRTSDGEVTSEDLKIRQNFLAMSWDREAEIMLCIALYEGAGAKKHKEKIELMRFKLARLRELRSIVSNTQKTPNKPFNKELLASYCDYCQHLLKQKENFVDVNLKLKLNLNHSDDEDLKEDFSYLEYLRSIILYMMRRKEKNPQQNRLTYSADDEKKIALDNSPTVPAREVNER